MRPDTTRRDPPGYQGRIHDSTMSPVFEAGYLLNVDPSRRPRPGDYIVVHTNDGQGFAKRLVRDGRRAIVCEQLDPPETMEFKRTDVREIHVVMGWCVSNA